MSPNNLPLQLTSFIGREHEIAEVKKTLGATRLLTLTGPGGSGKTRLSLAVAALLFDEYPDGIWLVELASLTEPDVIPQAIVSTLGLRGVPGKSLVDTIISSLKAKRMLLLLDNCEHLINACAQLAHTLLLSCPDLRILATSREPLHIAGEVTWLVPTLFLPDLRHLPALDGLAQVEAVRLFVDRAKNILPDFYLSEQNALAIARICCRLEGIPLAIELAAARMSILSAEEIASRLEDGFRLLVSRDRTVPSRHQTLHAALDWSYKLLPVKEQVLFRRLSVFAGGASLEAMEKICSDTGAEEKSAGDNSARVSTYDIQPEEILDLLDELVDKSLVQVEREQQQGRRYRLLEPVRQYSLEKFDVSGEEASVRGRHLIWYLDLAEQANRKIIGTNPKSWVDRIEQDYPNLRAAFDWSLAHPARVADGYRLVGSLAQFWQLRGYFSEGLTWLDKVLSKSEGVPGPLRANTLYYAGFIALHSGEVARARNYLERSLQYWQEQGDRQEAGWQKIFLGFAVEQDGDAEQAQTLGEEALAVLREVEEHWGTSCALFLLSDLAFLRGDYSTAGNYLEESLSICQQYGYSMGADRRLTRMGHLFLALGEPERTASFLDEGLRLGYEVGDQWGMAMAFAAKAALAIAQDQPERAARLLGITQALLDAFATHLWHVDRIQYDQNICMVKDRLGESAFTAIWDEGVSLVMSDLDGAVEFALAGPDPRVLSRSSASQEPGSPTSTSFVAEGRDFAGLTRRELEVAALIGRGMSNPEIASELFVGLRTVEAHVTHLLKKLGFNSRTQVAGWAVQKGLARPFSGGAGEMSGN